MRPGDRVVIVNGLEKGTKGYLVSWDSKLNRASVKIAIGRMGQLGEWVTLHIKAEDIRRA